MVVSEGEMRGEELKTLYKNQLEMRARIRSALYQKESDVFEKIEAKNVSMIEFKDKYDVWVQAKDVLGTYFQTVMNALMHMAVRAQDNDAFKFIADGADVNDQSSEDGETVLTWLCSNTKDEHTNYVCQMFMQPQISLDKTNKYLMSKSADWWLKVVIYCVENQNIH